MSGGQHLMASKIIPGEWKYLHVLEAIRALDGPASIKEIAAWLATRYPDENHSDARANASLLSVNDPNRHHYDHGRTDFRSDKGNPKDVLFRIGRFRDVRFDIYRPDEHGVWDIRPDAKGKWEAIEIEGAVSAVDLAFNAAQEIVAAEQQAASPIDNENDARAMEFRAIVLRKGQEDFRRALLNAYDRRCAITGSGVVEILEAAHICPYLGEHTNRPDNGLLLRADVHTLFDKGMIYVDPEGFVQIDSRLVQSEYAPLRGIRLRPAIDTSCQPHPEHLTHHRTHTARQAE